mgnify:CR=1 FL=1
MPAANVKDAVPYFRVVDMKASLAFYVEGLGFEIDQRWDDRGVLLARGQKVAAGGGVARRRRARGGGPGRQEVSGNGGNVSRSHDEVRALRLMVVTVAPWGMTRRTRKSMPAPVRRFRPEVVFSVEPMGPLKGPWRPLATPTRCTPPPGSTSARSRGSSACPT